MKKLGLIAILVTLVVGLVIAPLEDPPVGLIKVAGDPPVGYSKDII